MSARYQFEQLPNFIIAAFKCFYISDVQQLGKISNEDFYQAIIRPLNYWIKELASGREESEPDVKMAACKIVNQVEELTSTRFQLPLPLKHLIVEVHELAVREKMGELN